MYPHIKKYLAGKTSIEPFKVTTHNMYGTILFLSLEQKPKEHEKPLDFGDFMEIRIPKWHSDKHGPCISNKKIDIFNETVQRMMLHELKVELDTGNKNVGDIKRIIFDFRDRYGILDTELDYMNLRRQYNRQQEAEKKVNIFPKNLPQFMSYGFYLFAGLLTPIISVLSFDLPLI